LPAICDRSWFVNTFCEGEAIVEGKPVWMFIKKISLYDSLTLIANSPQLFREHFIPINIEINETTHSVIGISPKITGVKNSDKLQKFLADGLLQGLEV
jgi:hypothetical protein